MTLAFCNVTMLRLAAPTICVAPSGKPTMLATLILDYAMTSKFPWFALDDDDDNVIRPDFAKYTRRILRILFSRFHLYPVWMSP